MERRPPGASHETWVELQIRRAIERGEFDDLPGAGKPLPDYGKPYDELWWVKQKLRAENLPFPLPGTLALRKEAEEARARAAEAASEAEVRRIIADINAKILDGLKKAMSGPPLDLMPFDVEERCASGGNGIRGRPHRPPPPRSRSRHRSRPPSRTGAPGSAGGARRRGGGPGGDGPGLPRTAGNPATGKTFGPRATAGIDRRTDSGLMARRPRYAGPLRPGYTGPPRPIMRPRLPARRRRDRPPDTPAGNAAHRRAGPLTLRETAVDQAFRPAGRPRAGGAYRNRRPIRHRRCLPDPPMSESSVLSKLPVPGYNRIKPRITFCHNS